jgi:4'-phosphopantetheinyl transferase
MTERDLSMPQKGQSLLAISDNDIHVWLVKPDVITESALLRQYWQLIDAEESARIKRLRRRQQQHNSLLSRVLVRYVLSQYEGLQEQQWRFVSTAQGKPVAVYPAGYHGRQLQFNISHTQGLIVCAVSVTQAIGCDVETTKRQNNWQGIAQHYFSDDEQAHLFSLPKVRQRQRFFDLWTLKESVVKASGLGLAIGLDSFTMVIGEAGAGNVNRNIHQAKNSLIETAQRQSLLIYPCDHFTVAVTVDAPSRAVQTPYNLRCFDSVPLVSYQELTGLK